MDLGSIEWKPLGFLHEDIRNTRFLITILNDLWLMMVVVGVFYLIIRGTEVSAILFGAINLVIGYLIGRGQSAAGMYFNSRKDGKTDLEAAELIPAAIVEPPNVTDDLTFINKSKTEEVS